LEFTLPAKELFDVVSCSFLLQHARNEEMLIKFAKCAFNLLKPGGRLVGMNAGCGDDSLSLTIDRGLNKKYGN